MDPVSFLVTCVALYGLLKRTPDLIAEALAEREFAKRGEESPTAKARRERLERMGVDPAVGGAARQFAGNWWRDFWQDRDAERAQARASRLTGKTAGGAGSGSAPSWRDRLRDRIDAETTRRANRWVRRRRAETTPPVTRAGPPVEPTSPGDSADQGPGPTPGGPTPTGVKPPGSGPRGATPPPAASTRPTRPPPSGDTRRDPIRVDATVGPTVTPPTSQTAPNTSTTRTAVTANPAARAIEGGTTVTAVATREVTGVISGAAAARAVALDVHVAAEEFAARLLRARTNIAAIQEGARANLQLATYANAIRRLEQAVEAAAAAESDAHRCVAEVAPLMAEVAREFDRINS